MEKVHAAMRQSFECRDRERAFWKRFAWMDGGKTARELNWIKLNFFFSGKKGRFKVLNVESGDPSN